MSIRIAPVLVALTLTACGGSGRVVEIRMASDEKGNYFAPARVEVNRGDVLRFTLVSGIHNASFPTDKNPGNTNLPSATELLQRAGQTTDVSVDFAPGEYTYQCDPHAVLGMTGKVVVKD
ncbi:MAG TPA: plastocyanin/azurin family copper-binding protein [Longimicrobium sp.]|jgi:plastocyanin